MPTEPPTSPAAAPVRDVYTVSRLNREVRALLEGSLPLIWVEGEISNLARPSSGHIYFTLKDAQAQVRCAMFRNRNLLLRFRPEDGMQVLVRARVSLYEGRGEFQLIAEHMEEAGDGALRRAFEELKSRLAAQGLFDTADKIEAPALPQRIGVITSPTGAALRDILSVLARRFPAIEVVIYPVPVQGVGAAQRVAAAIATADRRGDCDVLLLARGGGSLEDLWPFNEEVVARAIHACRLPLVTGIGHEVDVTIADFAADHRAPTPSAAAEFLSPDRGDWDSRLAKLGRRLNNAARARLTNAGDRLSWLTGRLQQRHPGMRLRQHSQRLDELEQRLRRAQGHVLHYGLSRVQRLEGRLLQHNPLHRIEQAEARRSSLSERLRAAVRVRLDRDSQRVQALGRALDAVSPLATLGRGYAIVRRTRDQSIVRDAAGVRIGERVETQLARGMLVCTIEETHDKTK